MVFPWQRSTKHTHELLCTTRTFSGDIWQEAEAAIQVEHAWELLADADAIAVAELAQATLLDGMRNATHQVTVYCLGGEIVHGNVVECGADVVVIRCDDIDMAVPRNAILRVKGSSLALADEQQQSPMPSGLNFRRWIRQLRDTRIECSMVDGWKLRGRIVTIGQDVLRVQDFENEILDISIPGIAVIRSSTPLQ